MQKIKLIKYKLLWLIMLQQGFFLQTIFCQTNAETYHLKIYFIDKDSLFNPLDLKLKTTFANKITCDDYINTITNFLIKKGYPVASVDSVWQNKDATNINLFLGKQYKWISLATKNIEKQGLEESGFNKNHFLNKNVNFDQLNDIELKLLHFYQKTGYPFAQIFLDSITIDEDKINATLKVKEGILYHVDSFRIYGKSKISKFFLQHYLAIHNGDVYNIEKLQQISPKLLNLPYLQELQPSNISMLGNGSILNLYLAPKKSSQFNFLVGVLPSTSFANKFLLTADVNLDLKNNLNKGENILLNWQQLQPQSPKLNLGYNQPYIFNSNFGLDFSFDLYKKDSSYLQINSQLGLQYNVSSTQWSKIFLQWQNNFLLAGGINIDSVITYKKLPFNIDETATNVGITYNWINTDYHLNPRKGNDFLLTATTGIKKIKQNSDITSIKNSSFNYASLYDSIKLNSYQFCIKISAAHYFAIGKQGVVKAVLNVGMFNSSTIFKNDLFKIGGYKLLRGFDEESIFATQYVVGSTEYRYRIALNSYLFGFADGGWAKDKYQNINQNNSFVSSGVGMAFEAKFGLLNISFAVGKRNDIPFNLRGASKIHFGYVNYF